MFCYFFHERKTHYKFKHFSAYWLKMMLKSYKKAIKQHVQHTSNTGKILFKIRYISEIEENIKARANQITPEEFETFIEIFTCVLRKYLVPNDDIKQVVNYIGSKNYEMLRDCQCS